MTSYSLQTRLYVSAAYLAGLVVFFFHLADMQFKNPVQLVGLCLLASLALILKVEGPTSRSFYTFSLVVYGFTFVTFGAVETLIVVLISHLVEWLWYRSPWFMQLFNLSTYLLAVGAAGLAHLWINQSGALTSKQDILAIVIGMASFTAVSHLMTGAMLWLARRENFRKLGVFDPFPIILDVSLLYFGASLAIAWLYNPYALLLFIIPTYVFYRALRIPALERKTELDSKTGLFNHSYFKKQLDGELSRSRRFDRPLSVIIADLDLLRNINNTYGHLAGDEVLIGVANAMKRSVREYDVVARFGGEEFAILLPETTLVQAYEKAEFFRKMIEGMEFIVPTSKTPIRATMSFGVAHRESHTQTANEIVHNADLALYNSKLSGRNRTFAHANDAYFDLPLSRLDSLDGPAGVDLCAPTTYCWEAYLPWK